ncbi:MAG TPA: hypothetical protein EYQ50_17405 [Verrucomicrobiales bacterium]|nr:hypothetical protein [Verrucomicrobiales bacterium]HIL70875.1 hypothetical protein [Verrucomicrobiota bacterium]
MRNLFATLICLTPLIGCESETTSTSQNSTISISKSDKQELALSGTSSVDCEVVLRIAVPDREDPLEWTTEVDGKFEAVLSSSDELKLDDGTTGNGIVFTVKHDGVTGTSYIAMSHRDPVPSGVVEIRVESPETNELPAIKQDGNLITVADIACDDGTTIPITVLVRKIQTGG